MGRLHAILGPKPPQEGKNEQGVWGSGPPEFMGRRVLETGRRLTIYGAALQRPTELLYNVALSNPI
jgi:hypothetical protein